MKLKAIATLIAIVAVGTNFRINFTYAGTPSTSLTVNSNLTMGPALLRYSIPAILRLISLPLTMFIFLSWQLKAKYKNLKFALAIVPVFHKIVPR